MRPQVISFLNSHTMNPQETISHYRITAKLGAGGMDEVWRATDTKLGREVAIKVLPECFANDADRMARFTREAQVWSTIAGIERNSDLAAGRSVYRDGGNRSQPVGRWS